MPRDSTSGPTPPRTNEIAARLTVLPWVAAHGRAERFWQALGEPLTDADAPASSPQPVLSWSQRAMQAAVTWLQEADVPTVAWRERGRLLVLARVVAQRPAFDARQRQALVLSVALDEDRPYPPVHASRLTAHDPGRAALADGGDTLARGGLLLNHALSAVSLLAGLPTARDLLVLIEMRATAGATMPTGATEVAEAEGRALLEVAACVLAEAGGVPMDVGGALVLPVPVAQKAALWLRLRGRGRAIDPGLPEVDGAVDNLLAALALLREAERPLRICAASRAQVLGIADSVGVARGLAYRGLLNAATYGQASRRVADMAPYFDALLHDTWTVTRVQASGRPDAAGDDAWALLDCRIVPGRTTAQVLAELQLIVGERVVIDVLAERPGKESDLHAQVLRVLRQTLEARLPGARVVPRLQLAGCDAWGWRQSAVPCFGFSPVQLPGSIDLEPLWQRGAVPTIAAERAWGRSVFIEAVARRLVEA